VKDNNLKMPVNPNLIYEISTISVKKAEFLKEI
jgi:hypothetical protein